MPSFDVVSEIDHQEVRNAIDQVERELATRFDFKGTDSSVEQKDLVITLRTASEDRLRALRTVLEEKLVKRSVSLKGLEYGKVEDAAGNTVRQVATLAAGISSDKAKQINKMIKDAGLKGVQSQTQGEQVRVTGKKRDDLQSVISLLKSADLGVALQFTNFRD
jgi:cyclic-di-GMP-binding protein